MINEVVKNILDLAEHLAEAQRALYELRKFGISVKLSFENEELQIDRLENIGEVN